MADDDFERELAQRLRAYEARVPEGTPDAAGRSRRPRTAGWLILAVGAAGVVAAVLLAVVLLRPPSPRTGQTTPAPSASPTGEPSSPPSTPSGSVEGSPTPAATPTATADREFAVAWDQASLELHDGSVSSVVAEGGRFWALGARDGDPAIWTSTDGHAWDVQVLPWPDDLLARRDESNSPLTAEHLARVGDRFVAIGTLAAGGGDYRAPVVWSSADGTSWNASDDESLRPAFLLADVTAGPSGLVAVANGFAEGTGAVWRSDDGESWASGTVDDDDVWLWATVGTADAYVVAGARYVGSLQPTHPMIWRSSDGSSWQPAELEGADRDGWVSQLSVGSNGWVALGTLDGSLPAAWYSTDGGRTWSLADGYAPTNYDPMYGTLGHLASVGGSFVYVAGGTDQTLHPRPVETWVSPDGRSWSLTNSEQPSVDTGEAALRPGIARIGSQIVIAGVAVVPSSTSPDIPEHAGWFSWVGQVSD